MKLFATSAYQSHSCLDSLRRFAAADIHENHFLVSDSADADAIIFVENTHFEDLQFSQVQQHPLTLAYPDRVFMYNEMDQPWPVLPGLYCSLGSRLTDPAQHIAFPFLTTMNPNIQRIHGSTAERKWLYSFVGSRSHPIRRQMFSLLADNAAIIDTSEFCAWNPEQESANSYQSLYAHTMAASKFVLCPRGIGPTSLRLFETMEAGRVPVIISDQWSAPPQINWDFAVRIPESEIASIPQVLKQLEPQWQSRSLAAREAWQNAYSPESMFNSVGDAISQLGNATEANTMSLSIEVHKYKVLARYGLRCAANRVALLNQKAKSGLAKPSETRRPHVSKSE